MVVQRHDLLLGFRELRLGDAPVIVHSSLRSFGEVRGGARAVVGALRAVFQTILVPVFTYKCMLTPLTGPENNAITYGSGEEQNRLADFFTPRTPADPMMGIIPETLRRLPQAARSSHPILSFAGLNAGKILAAQSLDDPLAPLGELARLGGWVVLIGVDHTVNTSIHLGEKLAGRRQFVRWALTPRGVRECPGFPGDSAGFQAVAADMEPYTRRVRIGDSNVQALPLTMLLRVVNSRIKKDPLALLCQQADCERCTQIRKLQG